MENRKIAGLTPVSRLCARVAAIVIASVRDDDKARFVRRVNPEQISRRCISIAENGPIGGIEGRIYPCFQRERIGHRVVADIRTQIGIVTAAVKTHRLADLSRGRFAAGICLISSSTAFRESNKLNGRWKICIGDLLCKNDRRPAKGSEC